MPQVAEVSPPYRQFAAKLVLTLHLGLLYKKQVTLGKSLCIMIRKLEVIIPVLFGKRERERDRERERE